MPRTPTLSDLPRLVRELTAESWMTRKLALENLHALGPSARSAAEAMEKCLDDPDDMVRHRAAEALLTVAPDRNWCDWDLDPQLNAQEPGTIHRHPTVGDLPNLIATLRSQNGELRWAAITAIRKLGADANSAIPAVIRSLKDTNFSVAQGAALALGVIAQPTPEVLAALQAALEQRMVKTFAISALAWLGPRAFPMVLPLLDDRDPNVQCAAIGAISHIGIEPEVCVERLAKLTSKKVWSQALEGLRSFKMKAAPALPAMLEAFDAHRFSEEIIVETIRDCVPQDDPRMVAALDDPRPRVRLAAAVFLSRGAHRPRAMQELIQALASGEKTGAICSLALVEGHAPDAILAILTHWRGPTQLGEAHRALQRLTGGDDLRILETLNSKDSDQRLFTAAYLWNAGLHQNHAGTRLREGLKSRKLETRRQTMWLISFMMSSAPPACVELLAETTLKAERQEADRAASTLVSLGQSARHVAPKLAESFASADDQLRARLLDPMAALDVQQLRTLLHTHYPDPEGRRRPWVNRMVVHEDDEGCVERNFPTWEEIEPLVRRLDGERFAHLRLKLNNLDWMQISSGPRDVRCAGVFEATKFFVLLDPSRQPKLAPGEEPERVLIDRGNCLEYIARNETVSRQLAIDAVRHFCAHGELAPQLSWLVKEVGIAYAGMAMG